MKTYAWSFISVERSQWSYREDQFHHSKHSVQKLAQHVLNAGYNDCYYLECIHGVTSKGQE